MRLWDTVGYLAAGLVIMAFCMKDMMWLRVVALTSNVLFLVYGVGLGLVPVWLLHAILLPVNGWRLWQGICCRCIGRRELAAAPAPTPGFGICIRNCTRPGGQEILTDLEPLSTMAVRLGILRRL